VAAVETTLALEEDAPAAIAHAKAAGALLAQDSSDALVWWLTMHPRSAANETFYARIAWTRYPHSPPSVKFADAVGGRVDVIGAWPMCPGYRPGAYDICAPFTGEGFIAHPEWRTGPEAWTGTGNRFLWVVSILVHDMCDRYQGRAA
jgi:hypothetical protein